MHSTHGELILWVKLVIHLLLPFITENTMRAAAERPAAPAIIRGCRSTSTELSRELASDPSAALMFTPPNQIKWYTKITDTKKLSDATSCKPNLTNCHRRRACLISTVSDWIIVEFLKIKSHLTSASTLRYSLV